MRNSVAMKTWLLKESRRQGAEQRKREKEIEAIEEIIDLTEDRSGELIAFGNLPLRVQEELKKNQGGCGAF
jgi:hypothetical protein